MLCVCTHFSIWDLNIKVQPHYHTTGCIVRHFNSLTSTYSEYNIKFNTSMVDNFDIQRTVVYHFFVLFILDYFGLEIGS